MKSATKVLLETIQVARHLGRLGARPLEKAAVQAASAGEELAFWALKLQPVKDVLGQQSITYITDNYLQAKEILANSVASLSHELLQSTLQSGAGAATAGLRKAGVPVRVVGPFDEHWHTLRVLGSLRDVVTERSVRKSGGGSSLRLTPRHFVKIMREAERRKRRRQQSDPVEEYVQQLLSSGGVRRMGPMLFEKKLYTDVVRVITFCFDRTLLECSGTEMWGHVLNVRSVAETSEGSAGYVDDEHRPSKSQVCTEQIEALVDQMVRSQELQVPRAFKGMQKHLLLNCSTILLRLIEDLTSDRRMQVMLLGHALRIRLQPLPMAQILDKVAAEGSDFDTFEVNERAIDELVDALIEEPEIQLILVPDLIEARVYRAVLHRTMCIAQFILSHLVIRLFGIEVRMRLVAEQSGPPGANDDQPEAAFAQLQVTPEELQWQMERIEDEKLHVERELHSREEAVEASVLEELSCAPTECSHEFHKLAAQDRLSRSLSIQRTVEVPIEVAYAMLADFPEYPKWMPFCTSARRLQGVGHRCEVGFGLNTGTALGTVGDMVRYQVRLTAPTRVSRPPASGATPTSSTGEGLPALRVARVVADATDGFAYGRRLIYDWRFAETASGETDVRLDMFFQAKSVFFLPLWDSMQATITSVMMKKFIQRAGTLTGNTVVLRDEDLPEGSQKEQEQGDKVKAPSHTDGKLQTPPRNNMEATAGHA